MREQSARVIDISIMAQVEAQMRERCFEVITAHYADYICRLRSMLLYCRRRHALLTDTLLL